MTVIGPAGYPAGSRGPEDAVKRVADMGLGALEMQYGRGVRISRERAEKVGRVAASHGIRLSAHAPYYINFHSRNPETRERSVEWLLATARACHQMGASPAVIHAASYGDDPEGCADSVLEGLSHCLERMDQEGIRDVDLGLETMGKLSAWGSLSEVEDAVSALGKGVVPVIDLAHLHARHGGCLDNEDEAREILARGRRMSPERLHLHISGIEYGERGERKHLPLDSGSPPMDALLGPLREQGKGLTIIVESPPLEQDALWLQSLLRQ